MQSSISDSEYERPTEEQGPDQVLSTFVPTTRNILGETDIEWTLCLDNSAVSYFVISLLRVHLRC